MNLKCWSHFILSLCVLFQLFGVCFSHMKPVIISESALVPRVVNGQPAEYGDFPYQVGFRRKGARKRVFCGGTIIREDKVVSAAHCFGDSVSSTCTESVFVDEDFLRKRYVVAGALISAYNPRKLEGQMRDLKLVMYPSNYKFPYVADVAIVITKEPFVFNAYVNKIGYAKEYLDYRGHCVVSGFGRTDNKRNKLSDYLLYANLNLLTTYWCTKTSRRRTRKIICASSKYTDIGAGDSGGPLVCKNTGHPGETELGILVGIASGRRVTPRPTYSFFTRVSSYADYITNNHAWSIRLEYINYTANIILIFVYYYNGFYAFFI